MNLRTAAESSSTGTTVLDHACSQVLPEGPSRLDSEGIKSVQGRYESFCGGTCLQQLLPRRRVYASLWQS